MRPWQVCRVWHPPRRHPLQPGPQIRLALDRPACFPDGVLPCVIFEDEHLLVAVKPAGLNTHAPAPFAGEGFYDWLRHREPRWAGLAILHRLDKETSGVMVFGKTALANRSLTAQFTQRQVRKQYLLATDRPVRQAEFTVTSQITRAGERYVSGRAAGERAETHFREAHAAEWPSVSAWLQAQSSAERGKVHLLAAEPLTGRTHQIRVQAAERGFPILGDQLYGGSPAARVFLHAAVLELSHPQTGARLTFQAEPDFGGEPTARLRSALVEPSETTALRLLHGAADGVPGLYVDRLGEILLAQSEGPLTEQQQGRLTGMKFRSLYHQRLTRNVRGAAAETLAPQFVAGEPAPERFEVRENGVRFELSFAEGYSTGLFGDQRDNRRRLLSGHLAAGFALPPLRSGAGAPGGEVLNLFAYTCGFSVCAALAGASVTSVDLSRKYLAWGRRNFLLNGLDPAAHEFIFGDAFEWLKRLARKGRSYDVVLLDPPTFSASKTSGIFQARRHYGRLIAAVLPLLKPGGVMFASTNAADWPPPEFLGVLHEALRSADRRIEVEHYRPQPPDFPVTRAEPAYLKTVWLRVR
jgi:23S rRNA (cytosine1962-C5)-methyltransferase